MKTYMQQFRDRLLWQVGAAILIVLVLALVGAYHLYVAPPLHIWPGDEVVYWQLVLAYVQVVGLVLTVALAVIFGRAAIAQLSMAHHAAETDERQILNALFLELHHNRWVALQHEGRLRLPQPYVGTASLHFKRQIYDALLAGPLWRLRRGGEILRSVDQAYWNMQFLDIALTPFPVQVPPLTAALLASGVPRRERVGRFLQVVVVLFLPYVKAAIDVQRHGTARQARIAVEDAMQCVHVVMNGVTLDWHSYDHDLPDELKLSPEHPWRPVLAGLQSIVKRLQR